MKNWNQTTQTTPVLGKPSLGDASPGLPVWREQDRALYEIKARPLFLCPHVPAQLKAGPVVYVA